VRDDPTYIITLRNWAQFLVASGRQALADATSVTYLKYLKQCDDSEVRTVNSVRFWAQLLQENREALKDSEKFFKSNYPELDLNRPIEKRVFAANGRPPGTGPQFARDDS
jgi:hypothetical protein